MYWTLYVDSIKHSDIQAHSLSCTLISVYVACTAVNSVPFPGRDRTSERKSGRAKEHAWGEQKNWGEVGRGWARRGRSPHPLPLLIIFRTPSQFRSLPVSYWKRLLRRLYVRLTNMNRNQSGCSVNKRKGMCLGLSSCCWAREQCMATPNNICQGDYLKNYLYQRGRAVFPVVSQKLPTSTWYIDSPRQHTLRSSWTFWNIHNPS